MRMRRSARVLIAAFALCLLTGCKVEAGVTVRARRDGGGTVAVSAVLDKAAFAKLREAGDALALADLRRAGWRVVGPTTLPDGGARIDARRDFHSPAECEQLVAQIGGRDGPITAFALVQHRSFLKTTTTFDATVDLRQGVDTFTDGRFRELIGGTSLGLDQTKLEEQLGGPFASVFGMEVAARLPGPITSNAPAQSGSAVWPVKEGATAKLHATSTAWNTPVIVPAAISAAAALALVAVLARRLLARGGRKAASIN